MNDGRYDKANLRRQAEAERKRRIERIQKEFMSAESLEELKEICSKYVGVMIK